MGPTMNDLFSITLTGFGYGGDNGVAATDVERSGGATILIVDDDVDCRDAFESLLTDMPGVGAVRVGSPRDGIATIGAELPALIFIDCRARLQLNLGIVQMLKRLREYAPGASIVLMCLYPERLPRAARALLDRSIHKDVSYQELADLVRDVLAEREQLADGAA
jgi:DNA-binding NtrC family response regulator